MKWFFEEGTLVKPVGPDASEEELELASLAASSDPIDALALQLKQVDPKKLKPRPEGWRRVWFRGREPYFDIFIDYDGPDHAPKIRWLQMTLRGKMLTWSPGHDRLDTGWTNEMLVEPRRFASSKMLTTSSRLDGNFLSLALHILGRRKANAWLRRARVELECAIADTDRRPS